MDQLDLANRQELVKHLSYSFLIKKFEAEIYAEDVRRKAFHVLSKRLDCGDISDVMLFRMIGALGKGSENVFLEIHKAVFPPGGAQSND